MATGESAWVTDVDEDPDALASRAEVGARGRACARASPSRSSSARARRACSSSSPAARPRRIPGCCTSWTRSASSSGGWSSASARAPSSSAPTPTSRPSPTSPRTTWPSRCARSRASSRCSSASTAIASTTSAREFIAYAVDGVERMQRMIDDLLLYARAGTTDLRLERVDAARRGRRRAARPRAPPWPSAARPSRSASCRSLRGDPGQLQRVFQNLLGNAIKYTAPGVAPHVTVSGAQRRRRRRDRGRRQRDRHRPRRGRAGLRDVRPPPRPGGAVPGHRARAGHLAADRRAPRRAPLGRAQRRRRQRVQASRCRYRRSRSRAACSSSSSVACSPSSPSWSASPRSCSASSTPSGPSAVSDGTGLLPPARALPRPRLPALRPRHVATSAALGFQPIAPLLRAVVPGRPVARGRRPRGRARRRGVALGAVAQQRRGTLVARGARRLRGLRHERAGLLGRRDDRRLLPSGGGRDRAPADLQAQHLPAADPRPARVAAVAVAAVDHPRAAAGRHHDADDARVAGRDLRGGLRAHRARQGPHRPGA